MFFFLSNFSRYFGPLRLFDYVTFRAGGAAFTAFLITILLGGVTARLLRKFNAQSADRFAGLIAPELIDEAKNRTPCMGGILLIGSIIVSALLWCNPLNHVAQILICGTLAFSLTGFYDDWIKVVKRDRNGLSSRKKMISLILISAAVVWLLDCFPEVGDRMRYFSIPFLKQPLDWGIFCLPVAVFVIVGSSNAVNLTDGKDGLATGCTIFCVLTFAVFAYLMGHRVFADYLSLPHISGIEEAVIFAAAVCGSCIGFLWHNCHPASMFMGDTGSLALGGIIGMLAVVTRQELLLVLVGWVFVMEALSVMIQVGSFKLTGKRIFRCAPIHHHFEYLGWTETQIVVRFWIIAGLCALSALATLKLR